MKNVFWFFSNRKKVGIDLIHNKKQAKSFRLSEETISYIETFPGNNLSQSFESMVRFFRDEEKNRRKQIQRLEERLICYQRRVESTAQFLEEIVNSQKIAVELDTISKDLKNSVERLIFINAAENFLPDDIPFGENTR